MIAGLNYAPYVMKVDLIFIHLYFPPSSHLENKGKLILTEIFPSVQKHDIFSMDLIVRHYSFKVQSNTVFPSIPRLS